jgi:4-amino-4-deoxychorismate lyase
LAPIAHWVNGEPGGSLPANDRGFNYGDGVFETFRYHLGSIHLWELHRDRLWRGLRILGIDCPMERVEQQLQSSLEWLGERGVEQAAGRLAVSRGPGPRGYRPGAVAPTIVLSLSEIPAWRDPHPPLEIVICLANLARQPLLAGIKHANRLEQVLAARELETRGANEGLLLNDRGELVCAVSSNVFIARDGTLLTPPVSECGIEGTVRRSILEKLAPEAGIPVVEEVLHPADLEAATELFLTNAIHGIRSVSQCEGLSFTSTEWGDTLRESFHTWSETSA